jgi:uncharacterized protein (DUF362 family)
MGAGSVHLSDKDKEDLYFEKEHKTANFEDELIETNTTIDIQLTILNGIRIDPDFVDFTFIDKFEIT